MQTTDRQHKSSDERAKSGVEIAYSALKELCVNYELRPGEAINADQVSKQLGLSRTPVREALNRLAVEGLLRFVPNKGYSARELDVTEIVELYELRVAVETAAFRMACSRASDEEISALATYWRDVGRNYEAMTVPEIARNDEGFHDRLIALAKNEQILRTVRQVADRIRFCRMIDLENRTRRGPLYDEHIDILDALRTRDAEVGAEALREHISMSRDQAIEVIKEGLARIYMRGKTPLQASGD